MKRTLVWTSLLLALPACGDDTTNAEGGVDTEATDTGNGPGSSPTTSEDTTGSVAETEDDTTGTADATDTDEPTDTDGEPPPMAVLDHIGGGQPGALELAGSHAYTGIGPRLVVWDLSDSSAPTQVGGTEPLPGLVTGIAVHGQIAYVSLWLDLEGSVVMLDVSDPHAPALMGTVDYTNSAFSLPTAVRIDGDTLFVSDMEVGIVSLDITTPDQPAVIDTLEVFGVTDIVVSTGQLRYRAGAFIGGDAVGTVTHLGGVMLEIGSTSLPDMGLDIAFDGDRVYNAGLFGFFAYDLSDPEMAMTVFSDEAMGSAVAAADDVAYNFGDGLTVFDFTGAQPAVGPTVDAPTGRAAVTSIDGGRLVGLTELGVGLVFDVSSPSTPSSEGVFELPVPAPTAAVVTSAGLAFADFYTGLRIVDPRGASVGRFQVEGAQVGVEDLDVVGDLAYLADWSSGLYIVDISNPASPTLVRHVVTPGHPSSVSVAGNYAYIGESTNGGSVLVVDVSDPAEAAIVAGVSATHVFGLVHRDGFVYVADQAVFDIGGMRVIDVSDPTNPVQAAHYTTCDSALAVALDGDRAFLACTSDELHIVDISTPSAPVLEQAVPIDGHGVWSVAAADGLAWVGYGMGIAELDVSTPGSAQTLYDYPTAIRVQRLVVTPDGVLGIAGMAGTYRLSR